VTLPLAKESGNFRQKEAIMQQTVDIEGIRALFEEMMEGEKANFLHGYTDISGNVHPSGARRWKFTEDDYRKRFAELLGPPPAPAAAAPAPAPYDPKDHSACIACKAGINYDHNPIAAPPRGMLPEIEVITPPNDNRGGYGRAGGMIEKLCYFCGRLDSEHLSQGGTRKSCPPDEIIPK
jgi:hypothetical protein